MVKYKKIRYKGVICDRCGVEVTKVQRPQRAYGTYRAGCSGIPYLVFQGNPQPYGSDPGHFSKNSGESSVLCFLYRTGSRVTQTFSTSRYLSEKEYREAVEKYGSSMHSV